MKLSWGRQRVITVKFIAVAAWLFYRALSLTWRVRVHEPTAFKEALSSGEPLVFAHWHGDELAILHLLARYRACAMVSTSKDGEVMSIVVKLLGARTSRGSSTRGGAGALRGLLRLAKQGYRPSVAVDGPKGPYRKAKPGVFEISRLTHAKIFPIAAAASKAKVFERSWNKAYLPLPFSRVEIVWGNALPALDRTQDGRDARLAEELESALANAGQEARNILAPLRRPV